MCTNHLRRRENKVHYDKSAKTLSMLQPDDTVRMQTDRGYDKIAIIESRTNDPRSYIVKCNGKQYRRNANIYYSPQKLLNSQMMMIYRILVMMIQMMNNQLTTTSVFKIITSYHTKYGRACLPNSRYQNDYV